MKVCFRSFGSPVVFHGHARLGAGEKPQAAQRRLVEPAASPVFTRHKIIYQLAK
jgi:hypothetical protein